MSVEVFSDEEMESEFPAPLEEWSVSQVGRFISDQLSTQIADRFIGEFRAG